MTVSLHLDASDSGIAGISEWSTYHLLNYRWKVVEYPDAAVPVLSGNDESTRLE